MYNQSPTSNLMFRATPATRPSPPCMDRLLPSSTRPASRKNLLSFPMTSPQPMSLTWKTTALGPSLPRLSRTPSLLTSLASHPLSSSIQLGLSISFPIHPAMLPPTPMPSGLPSSPSLGLPLLPTSKATPLLTPPPTTNNPAIPILPTILVRLTQTPTALRQVTP